MAKPEQNVIYRRDLNDEPLPDDRLTIPECWLWSRLGDDFTRLLELEGIRLAEIEFQKRDKNRHLRRQMLQLSEGGWTLSVVEYVGIGPKSLRGYEGGWQFPSRIYPNRKLAERNLLKNGWSPITQQTLRR